MTVKQVDAKAHYLRRYLTLPRSVTHWHLAAEVAESIAPGSSVLEIGVGCGHTTWMLRHWGYRVTTLDFDPELAPDIVADVRHIPADTASFDCVLAAEVLEHLPFDDFETALAELKRVSKGRVIITLPAPFAGLSALINLPRFRPWGIHIGAPWKVRHRWDGQHYRELGKRDTVWPRSGGGSRVPAWPSSANSGPPRRCTATSSFCRPADDMRDAGCPPFNTRLP